MLQRIVSIGAATAAIAALLTFDEVSTTVLILLRVLAALGHFIALATVTLVAYAFISGYFELYNEVAAQANQQDVFRNASRFTFESYGADLPQDATLQSLLVDQHNIPPEIATQLCRSATSTIVLKTDVQSAEFLELLLRDFIDTWYQPDLFGNLCGRVSDQPSVLPMIHDFLKVLTAHIAMHKQMVASAATTRSVLWDGQPLYMLAPPPDPNSTDPSQAAQRESFNRSEKERYLAVMREYTRRSFLHIACDPLHTNTLGIIVDPTNEEASKTELEYIRTLSQQILAKILPPAERASPVASALFREVLSTCVLSPVMGLAEPDTVNYWLDYLFQCIGNDVQTVANALIGSFSDDESDGEITSEEDSDDDNIVPSALAAALAPASEVQEDVHVTDEASQSYATPDDAALPQPIPTPSVDDAISGSAEEHPLPHLDEVSPPPSTESVSEPQDPSVSRYLPVSDEQTEEQTRMETSLAAAPAIVEQPVWKQPSTANALRWLHDNSILCEMFRFALAATDEAVINQAKALLCTSTPLGTFFVQLPPKQSHTGHLHFNWPSMRQSSYPVLQYTRAKDRPLESARPSVARQPVRFGVNTIPCTLSAERWNLWQTAPVSLHPSTDEHPTIQAEAFLDKHLKVLTNGLYGVDIRDFRKLLRSGLASGPNDAWTVRQLYPKINTSMQLMPQCLPGSDQVPLLKPPVTDLSLHGLGLIPGLTFGSDAPPSSRLVARCERLVHHAVQLLQPEIAAQELDDDCTDGMTPPMSKASGSADPTRRQADVHRMTKASVALGSLLDPHVTRAESYPTRALSQDLVQPVLRYIYRILCDGLTAHMVQYPPVEKCPPDYVAGMLACHMSPAIMKKLPETVRVFARYSRACLLMAVPTTVTCGLQWMKYAASHGTDGASEEEEDEDGPEQEVFEFDLLNQHMERRVGDMHGDLLPPPPVHSPMLTTQRTQMRGQVFAEPSGASPSAVQPFTRRAEHTAVSRSFSMDVDESEGKRERDTLTIMWELLRAGQLEACLRDMEHDELLWMTAHCPWHSYSIFENELEQSAVNSSFLCTAARASPPIVLFEAMWRQTLRTVRYIELCGLQTTEASSLLSAVRMNHIPTPESAAASLAPTHSSLKSAVRPPTVPTHSNSVSSELASTTAAPSAVLSVGSPDSQRAMLPEDSTRSAAVAGTVQPGEMTSLRSPPQQRRSIGLPRRSSAGSSATNPAVSVTDDDLDGEWYDAMADAYPRAAPTPTANTSGQPNLFEGVKGSGTAPGVGVQRLPTKPHMKSKTPMLHLFDRMKKKMSSTTLPTRSLSRPGSIPALRKSWTRSRTASMDDAAAAGDIGNRTTPARMTVKSGYTPSATPAAPGAQPVDMMSALLRGSGAIDSITPGASHEIADAAAQTHHSDIRHRQWRRHRRVSNTADPVLPSNATLAEVRTLVLSRRPTVTPNGSDDESAGPVARYDPHQRSQTMSAGSTGSIGRKDGQARRIFQGFIAPLKRVGSKKGAAAANGSKKRPNQLLRASSDGGHALGSSIAAAARSSFNGPLGGSDGAEGGDDALDDLSRLRLRDRMDADTMALVSERLEEWLPFRLPEAALRKGEFMMDPYPHLDAQVVDYCVKSRGEKSKKVLYRVKVTCGRRQWVLFVRFSQFHTLYTLLRENAPGFVADFPPKTDLKFTMAQDNPAFLGKRREHLNKYMQHVCTSPLVADCFEVVKFLAHTDSHGDIVVPEQLDAAGQRTRSNSHLSSVHEQSGAESDTDGQAAWAVEEVGTGGGGGGGGREGGDGHLDVRRSQISTRTFDARNRQASIVDRSSVEMAIAARSQGIGGGFEGVSAGASATNGGPGVTDNATTQSTGRCQPKVTAQDAFRLEGAVYRLASSLFNFNNQSVIRRTTIKTLRKMLRVLLHGQLAKQLNRYYAQYTAPPFIASLVQMVKDAIFPGGNWMEPSTPRTFREKADVRQMLLVRLRKLIPASAGSVLGTSSTDEGLQLLHTFLQNPVLVKSVAYTWLDLVLLRLFDDIRVHTTATSERVGGTRVETTVRHHAQTQSLVPRMINRLRR